MNFLHIRPKLSTAVGLKLRQHKTTYDTLRTRITTQGLAANRQVLTRGTEKYAEAILFRRYGV